MKEDPIIAEIHATRRQIMAECGTDPEKFDVMLKKAQLKHQGRLVNLKTKPRRARQKVAKQDA